MIKRLLERHLLFGINMKSSLILLFCCGLFLQACATFKPDRYDPITNCYNNYNLNYSVKIPAGYEENSLIQGDQKLTGTVDKIFINKQYKSYLFWINKSIFLPSNSTLNMGAALYLLEEELKSRNRSGQMKISSETVLRDASIQRSGNFIIVEGKLEQSSRIIKEKLCDDKEYTLTSAFTVYPSDCQYGFCIAILSPIDCSSKTSEDFQCILNNIRFSAFSLKERLKE
jgi:hypothetical protein